MTSIGWATLSVIPSFDGFRRDVETGTGRAMEAAGKSGGNKFGTAATKEIGDALAALPRTARGSISYTSKEFFALSPEMKIAVADANREAANLLSSRARGEIADNAKRAGHEVGESFGAEAADAGGEAFSDKIGDGVKKGALAAGAAAGLALGVGVVGALEKSALSDRLAAQLGVGEEESAALGKVAGELYSDAYGDSLEGVNGALRSVVTNLDGFRNTSKARLKDVTASVLDLNAAFDEEPEAISRAAAQMVRTDLAKGPRQALNIITRGFQTGADKSQDLLDTFNEYGTQFRKLGLNGRKATGLLSQGLEGGARDADIVADSLKEFSLKTQEATTETQKLAGGETALNLTDLGAAFEAVGVQVLDVDNNLSRAGQTFQQDLAGGGEKAKAALDKVLDGLREIDDPLERNRTAVALFGTQAEDMGDALYSLDLDTAAKKLGKVGGAAEDMGKTLSDNASTKIESFKRKMQTGLVDFIGNEFIPFFEDDVQPILSDFAAWFERDGADALRDFGGDVKDITGEVETLVGFLNDLPKPAKVAGLLTLVGGVGAAKIRGGGNGALAGAGKVLGLSKPVNVFVTNPGFGAGGGGTGVDGGGGKGGALLTKLGGVAALASVAIPVVDYMLKDNKILDVVDDAGKKTNDYFTSGLTPTTAEPRPYGLAAPGAGLSIDEGDKAKAIFDELTAKAKGFEGVLDVVGNKKVDPTLTVPGLREAERGLQDFLALQIEARKPITPYVTLTGYDRALAQIETLTAKIHSIPGAGVDNGLTYASGGGTSAGIVNNFTGPINATDTKDITRQAQRRAQQRGLGGRP